MAELLGCYKTVLTCKEDKVPFYEKCGIQAPQHDHGVLRPYWPGHGPARSSLDECAAACATRAVRAVRTLAHRQPAGSHLRFLLDRRHRQDMCPGLSFRASLT